MAAYVNLEDIDILKTAIGGALAAEGVTLKGWAIVDYEWVQDILPEDFLGVEKLESLWESRISCTFCVNEINFWAIQADIYDAYDVIGGFPKWVENKPHPRGDDVWVLVGYDGAIIGVVGAVGFDEALRAAVKSMVK